MMDVNAVNELLAEVGRLSLQATALAALVALCHAAFRNRIQAQWRFALWTLPFLRLLVPWSVSAPFSLPGALRAAAQRISAEAPLAHIQDIAESQAALLGWDSAGHGLDWPWLAASWAVGAAAVLAFSLIQVLRMRRQTSRYTAVTDPAVSRLLEECKLALNVRARVDLLATRDGAGPALLGCLRPRILLPEPILAPEARTHLRYVLLHELAHLKRRDILTGWLTHWVMAVHWFNPVLWWARRRLTAERELACDAAVLMALRDDERRSYGHALLDQVQRGGAASWSPGLAGALAGASTMERRIALIAGFRTPTWANALAGALAALLVSVAAFTDSPRTAVALPSTDVAPAMASAPEPPLPDLFAEASAPVTPDFSAVPVPAPVVAPEPSVSRVVDEPKPLDTRVAQPAPKHAEPEPVAKPITAARPAVQRAEKKSVPAASTRSDASALAVWPAEGVADSPPSRIRQRLEYNLALRADQALDPRATEPAVSEVKDAPRVLAEERVDQGAGKSGPQARSKGLRNKIGATWRSVRNALGADGAKETLGRGDRFDPAFVGSIVGPAANGGNSSLVSTPESGRGVEVTMSFSRPSFRMKPKVEWGFGDSMGARAAS